MPIGVDVDRAVREVTYVGSPEHKDTKSMAGAPKLRRNAAICDRSLAESRDTITEWVRNAIRKGLHSGDWQGNFPKYIWHREGNVVYEGRLVTPGRGDYKGYPIDADQVPKGV